MRAELIVPLARDVAVESLLDATKVSFDALTALDRIIAINAVAGPPNLSSEVALAAVPRTAALYHSYAPDLQML